MVRVLSIESPKSPAAIAGLVPGKDFILGTTHQTLDSVDQLASVLRQFEDDIVELYVYNTEDDRVRVVALLPTATWEGSRGGLLGGDVGTGYLHRLPFTARSTAGSSVERKVRYVEALSNKDRTVNIEAQSTEQNAGRDKGTPKVLELEPQLEMEPGFEDGTGNDQTLVVNEIDNGIQDKSATSLPMTNAAPEVFLSNEVPPLVVSAEDSKFISHN